MGIFPALLALGLVGVGISLEGAVLPAYGGWVLGLGAFFGVVFGYRERPRLSFWLWALLLGLLIFQAIPLPYELRALLEPGLSQRVLKVAPEQPVGGLDLWLDTLARYDLLAAMGGSVAWTHQLLQEGVDTANRPLAILPSAQAWGLVQYLAIPFLWLFGKRLGKSRTSTLTFLVGMVCFGVVEAVFGLANREGPSTGIGIKSAYLGSVTGTFINRSHFAAFELLCLGSAWALAAKLFPLIPEEVKRHRQRKNRSSQPPSLIEVAGDKLTRLSLLAFLGAVMAVGLVMSRGRAPLMAFLIVGVVTGLYLHFKKKEAFHLGIAMSIPLGGILLSGLTFGIRGSIGRFFSVISQDDSVISRLGVWKASLQAFKEAPIFGVGPGGFNLSWALHHPSAMLYEFDHAHNELLQQLVEVGVAGTVLIGLILYLWLWPSFKNLSGEHRSIVGLWVGVVAVLGQSVVDFPLHIPGVLLPFCLLAGILSGILAREESSKPSFYSPALLAGAGIVLVLGAQVAIQDASIGASRARRLGSVPAIFYDSRGTGPESEVGGWLEDLRKEATFSPLDPYLHTAIALAESRLARGSDAELHAFAAEVSMERALWLRNRDPRIRIYEAQVWLRLGERLTMKDAYQARAAAALALAVELDGWRAEDVFKVAKNLPGPLLERIVVGGAANPLVPERVWYEYGQALSRRGEVEGAIQAFENAASLKKDFALPCFRLGELYQKQKDEQKAQEAFQDFLRRPERPEAMEGWALYHLGDFDGAQSRFKRAVFRDNTNKWAWQGLAAIGKHRKDRVGERKALETLMRLDPSDKHVQERLKELKKER
jgi:O-antigen ligase